MTARSLAVGSVAVLVLLAVAFYGGSDEVPRCSAPAELTRLGVALPNTARAVREGRKLVIVAIGSSSTQGIGASDPAYAYPAVLADELRRRWPHLPVTVINKGIGGETVSAVLARFERDVLSHRPQLVIWQTGSLAALGAGDVEGFVKAMELNGIARRVSATDEEILLSGSE